MKTGTFHKHFVDLIKQEALKQRVCFFDDCGKKAIQSHVIQRRILENIADAGHIYLIENHLYDPLKIIRKKGISKSFTFSLFCSKHDSEFFKLIEQEQVDWTDYCNNLRLAYRTIVCELAKKELIVQRHYKLLNRIEFMTDFDNNQVQELKRLTDEFEWGIADLGFYKNDILNDLNLGHRNWEFYHIQSPINFGVAANAFYTPFPSNWQTSGFYTDSKPLPAVLVNVLPTKHCTHVLLGKCSVLTSTWIDNYISKWMKADSDEVKNLITDLITARTELWALNPSFFETLNPKTRQEFEDFWHQHGTHYEQDLKVDFNLFN